MALRPWINASKLVVDGTGKVILCEDCPCEVPPANTCNACDPPIPDTLYVTFDGLAGDFAAYNGKQAVAWAFGCQWNNGPETVYLAVIGGEWCVTVNPAWACAKSWYTGEPLPCAPQDGTYAADPSCVDLGCEDPDTCEDSAGATAVVSLA